MLKFLSTIWLVLALVTVPVQAFSASPEQATEAPCDMHMDGYDAAAGSDCPHCIEKACTDSNSCTDNSCLSVHIHPAAVSAVHLAGNGVTDVPCPAPASFSGSGAAPPLLRPPV